MDRCQDLFQLGHALAVRVCCAKFLQLVAQTLRSARRDVIGRARRQSRRRSFPSAALRKIHIFFDEGSAHPEVSHRQHRASFGNRVLKIMEKMFLRSCFPERFNA